MLLSVSKSLKRRRPRRRSDTVDMFGNYEKLIVSMQARVTRLEKTLSDARAELEAARHALTQMKASQPPVTSPAKR